MPTICCSWTDGSINARRRFKLLSDFNDKAVMDRGWLASQATKPFHGLSNSAPAGAVVRIDRPWRSSDFNEWLALSRMAVQKLLGRWMSLSPSRYYFIDASFPLVYYILQLTT